jgi:metal-sulfur cluster biosynthetic enzyme
MNQPAVNRPAWDSEKDQPELCEKLRTGFAEIVDPEIGLNIIQLGLIRNVKIEADNTMVKMILTTPFCPYGPAMIETTRQKAEEVLNRPANIDFSMEMWDFSMMEEGLGADWGLY